MLDILSLVVLRWRHQLPSLFVDLVCKAYIASLIWGVRSAFTYVLIDIIHKNRYQKTVYISCLISLLQSIIVFFLPIHIFDDGNAIYTYGSSVVCVYIFVAVYILITFILAAFSYKCINKRRGMSIMLWMSIWSFSAIVQFFNNQLLIVGFASATGVLILFVVIENPEVFIEKGLGCFNSYAMESYINQLIEENQPFGVLEISFEKASLFEDSNLDDGKIFHDMLQVLKPFKDICVFKNINLSFVLVSENMIQLQNAGGVLIKYFSEFENLDKKIMFLMTTKGDSFENADELFRFFSFSRTEYINKKGSLLIADEEIIRNYKEIHLIEKEITDALAENRVEVFLQPIYSNSEHRFTSAEALVRIRQNNGQFLSPGLFIPVAENNGQILELGERVFEKVCSFLKDTSLIKYAVHYIEVNLSVVQCQHKNLASRLIHIAQEYDIDPHLINLEITETGSVTAKTILLENMNKLIEYGFSFSLDDFGKGESNLMYVVDMPVSIVKLDYDICKAFFSSSKAKYVVRAVINMAHEMNLKLVAEGIETKEELDSMYNEHIDYIQGYYYSKPLPIADALKFYEQMNRY